MLTALLKHIKGLDRDRSIRIPGFATYRAERHAAGEILDESTANEITDALYKLIAVYREEALRHILPNRRVSVADLQHAANAQAMVKFYGVDAASAIGVISGNPRHANRATLARTLRNRSKTAELLGVQPEWNVVVAAMKKIKPKAET